ncbi:hypothetical protein NDU88_005255 [Pleurodeles waltl]|uniref:Uncharacterized protein n=1 Tax=Pleurodeles waltl TaxID=8319 RepID=A0AAV7PI18_PLEWA|nr:hypothetical protein NDU88_005255 [Pleurodeles waltl]
MLVQAPTSRAHPATHGGLRRDDEVTGRRRTGAPLLNTACDGSSTWRGTVTATGTVAREWWYRLSTPSAIRLGENWILPWHCGATGEKWALTCAPWAFCGFWQVGSQDPLDNPGGRPPWGMEGAPVAGPLVLLRHCLEVHASGPSLILIATEELRFAA